MEYVTKNELDVFRFNLLKTIRSKAFKMQVRTRTLSADLDLKSHDRRVQFIDPGGANRIVNLPPAFMLDGVPWIRDVQCQNGTCTDCPHSYTQNFSNDLYFYIFNLADGAEDLTVKFGAGIYTTQNSACTGGTHDIPVLQSQPQSTVMTISQNEGGLCFCNGAEWRGFVGSTT